MNQSAELLFYGGSILTLDPLRPRVDALAVNMGRIQALGTREVIEELANESTQRVNLQGRTLLPGFVEAHAHPFGYGRNWGDPLINIRASHIPSFEAVVATIKRRVAKAEKGEVLAFVGLDALRHTGMHEPTLREMDDYAPENPLAIYTFNFHSLFVNSKMMERLGLTPDTPDFPGGRYVRDEKGHLTGKMVEFAAFKNFQAVCDLFGNERGFRELKEGMLRFAKGGITTVGDIGLHEGALGAYQKLQQQESLPIRMRIYERAQLDGPEPQILNWGGDDVQIVGVKVWADGSPFVGTAWLSRPYLNSEVTLKGLSLPKDYQGHMNFDISHLRALINRYAALGCQIATHVQGDLTIDAVLDVYQQAITQYGKPRLPYRLEHCGTMREDQIHRAIELGVTCSFFVPHIYHWGDPIRDSLLGAERAGNYMPSGTATRLGMRVSFHSDAPMTEPDPLLAIQTAVTRQTATGVVLGEHQKVTVDQALKAMTLDAAFQLGMEDQIGSLEVGKRADFVLLKSDPHAVAPDSIAAIPVLGTWIDGRNVWLGQA